MALRDLDYSSEKIQNPIGKLSCEKIGLSIEHAESTERIQFEQALIVGSHLSSCNECATRYGSRLFQLQKKLIAQVAEENLKD